MTADEIKRARARVNAVPGHTPCRAMADLASALLDEVDSLRAALAQARADALGEAARVADEQGRAWQGTGRLCADARAAEAGVIAMRIRALQSTPPASAPPACDGSGWLPPDVAHAYAGRLRCHGCPNCKSKERR